MLGGSPCDSAPLSFPASNSCGVDPESSTEAAAPGSVGALLSPSIMGLKCASWFWTTAASFDPCPAFTRLASSMSCCSKDEYADVSEGPDCPVSALPTLAVRVRIRGRRFSRMEKTGLPDGSAEAAAEPSPDEASGRRACSESVSLPSDGGLDLSASAFSRPASCRDVATASFCALPEMPSRKDPKSDVPAPPLPSKAS